jgi:ribosomal protein L39E
LCEPERKHTLKHSEKNNRVLTGFVLKTKNKIRYNNLQILVAFFK